MNSSTVSLALSLLFAVGQIVVGGGLVWYGLARGRWRRARIFVAVAVGAWFFGSGVVELFVSGMETAYRVVGRPGSAFFALWRGRADVLLLLWTLLLALLCLAYFTWQLWQLWQHHRQRAQHGSSNSEPLK